MQKNNSFPIQLMSNPKYRGKHLIIVAGRIFTAKTGRQAAKVFEQVTKKFRNQTPTIAYIPKADTLILWQG